VRHRWEKGFVLNNVGAIFASNTWEPTFAYNIDGAGASNIPYFNEMGAIYRYYRVRSWTMTVYFANLETFNIVCYLVPVNTVVAANSANWQWYLSNPVTKMAMLGPLTGMNRAVITQNVLVSEFSGSKDTQTDDLYSGNGLSGTAPTNNTYQIIGIESPSAVVLANCVTVVAIIDFELDWFELNLPQN
jgi:hypothetical protein